MSGQNLTCFSRRHVMALLHAFYRLAFRHCDTRASKFPLLLLCFLHNLPRSSCRQTSPSGPGHCLPDTLFYLLHRLHSRLALLISSLCRGIDPFLADNLPNSRHSFHDRTSQHPFSRERHAVEHLLAFSRKLARRALDFTYGTAVRHTPLGSRPPIKSSGCDCFRRRSWI